MHVRFGTQLTIDTHPMTQREVAKWSPEARQGVEQAGRMLAADGTTDTLNLFYADDMAGQSVTEPNYLGFELNGGYPYHTLPVFKLHHAKSPVEAVRIVFEALWTLKNRGR